jgi:D-alanyl-lipoteichoic acid acyltransferase DltB (MBOAT superfamily)
MVFIAVTFMMYFIIPINWRWVVLLISSILFYGYAGIEKIPFVLAVCLIAYITTRIIEKIYESNNPDRKKAKRILILAVVVIVVMLMYSKVGRALYGMIDDIFNFDFDLNFIVPLGISYYTFSIIGYMADVYWKKDKAEHNYFKLLLYMIYFPHILQGPIARHKKLSSQLIEGHRFDYKNMCYGLQRVVWGYFKKLVIADRLALLTSEVFGNYQQYEGLYFVVAVICAAIELYCDFSGCMDIALGISEALSVNLDENFNHPFYSKTASEFWRRWHITLGTWFKDYIYMPMVINPHLIKLSQKTGKIFGKRFGKSMMTVIPLAIVWILTGLWHSTGLSYVVWGCYWGIIIIVSTVFAPEFKKISEKLNINTESQYWQAFQIVRTFVLFLISRLITVPNDLTVTVFIIKKIFNSFNIWRLFDQSIYNMGLDLQDFWVGAVAIILLWKVSSLQEKGVCIRDKIASCPIVIRWTIYYAGILAILIFGIYGSGITFTYMQY